MLMPVIGHVLNFASMYVLVPKHAFVCTIARSCICIFVYVSVVPLLVSESMCVNANLGALAFFSVTH